MRCHVLLAVRPVEEGKSRLSDALTDDQRISLNHNMFRHVLSIIMDVVPGCDVTVISRSDALLDEARSLGAHGEPETGHGLNKALWQGSQAAVGRGATALLALSSDLPFLTVADVEAMLATSGDVVIATDRAGTGTNALLLRHPLAMPFRYGLDSLAAHRAAAAVAGLEAVVIDRPGLARDIDTPADLAELDRR